MKAQRGSRVVALLFLYSRRKMECVVNATPRPLYPPPGTTRYPLYRRLGGTQGRSGEVRKISPPTWFFPVVKRPGRGAEHPPLPSAEVKGRVELYLYSPSGSSWPVLGSTLSSATGEHQEALLHSYFFLSDDWSPVTPLTI